MDRAKYLNEANQLIGLLKTMTDKVKKLIKLTTFEMKWESVVRPYIRNSDDEEVDEIDSHLTYYFLKDSQSLSKEEQKRWQQWIMKEPQSSFIDNQYEQTKIEYNKTRSEKALL